MGDVKRAGVKTPVLYDINLEDKSILMEEIEGDMLKDIINEDLAFRIGVKLQSFTQQISFMATLQHPTSCFRMIIWYSLILGLEDIPIWMKIRQSIC